MRAEAEGAGETGPVAAVRAHAAGRRLRLRLSGRHDRAAMETLADRLAAVPGVVSVAIRPNTRSVILEGEIPAGDLAGRLEEGGVVRLSDPGAPPPVGQVMELGLLTLDGRLKARSQGALDLNATLALLLLSAAAVQAVRGQVAGPATTLAMAAFTLIRRGGGGR